MLLEYFESNSAPELTRIITSGIDCSIRILLILIRC